MKKIRYIIFIMMLLCFSCNGKNTKQGRDESIYIYNIKDTIINTKKVRIFGDDSIYTYYKDNLSIHVIEYLDKKAKIVQKGYYKDGRIKLVRYNCELMGNSILEEIFFQSTGAIWQQTFCVDTIIITDNNPKKCHELYIAYHENGKMEFSGYFGMAEGQISAIGIQKRFDESGRLAKTENFIYPVNKQPYIIISEYYENGKPKWEKVYVNHIIHESEQEEPIGNWKFYDASGKLIRTEQYPPNK